MKGMKMTYSNNIFSCPYLNNYYKFKNIYARNVIFTEAVKLQEQKLVPSKLSIFYPFIPNANNNKAYLSINNAITDEVSKLFKQQVLLPEVSDFNEIYGRYEITVNKNNIISILFSLYTYINKAAHGFTAYSSVTANTNTGQIYSFSDLFNSKIYYVGFLNELAKQYIKDNNIPLINAYNGITPNQQYYLTEDSLVLYYQVYEYTPYYYGLFKIEIPSEKIKNLLGPLSPINRLIAI